MPKRLRWAAALPLAAMGVQEVAAATIEEIVVTARKRAENLQEVPIAISAFSDAELENQTIQEFVDLKAQLPGVYISQVQGDPSAAIVTIRGQSQADTLLTTDSSVGVYVDGVNLPRQQALNANIFDLERVEVLKGPQGTLYGRNTTGGAINLIARKPDYRGWHGYLSGTTGNENYTQMAGAVNVPLADNAAARFAVQKTDQDGWGKSNFSGKDLYDQDELFVRGSLLFDATDRLSILLQADYLDVDESGAAEKLMQPGGNPLAGSPLPATPAIVAGVELGALNPQHIPPSPDVAPGPTFVPGLAAGYAALAGYADGSLLESDSNADVFSKAEMWGGGLTVSYAVSDTIELKSITGYRKWETDRLLDMDGTPFTILHPHLSVDADFFSQELQLLGAADRLDWVLGAYYSTEDGTDGSVTTAAAAINPVQPNVLDGDVENSSWAVFAQGTYALTDRLDVTAGLRYTEEKKKLTSRNRTFNQMTQSFQCELPGNLPIDQCAADFSDTFNDPSWLLSADYRLTDQAMVYASIARGFRGGGQNIRGGADPSSFSSFEPEIATTYELGFKGDLLNSLVRLNASAYFTDYEDIQRSIIVPGSGGNVVTILTNAAEAEVTGFEAELWVYPTDALSLFATVAYTDFEYQTFESLGQDGVSVIDRSGEDVGLPDWQYSLSARYEWPIGSDRLAAQVDYYWQDDLNTAPTSAVPDAVIQQSYGLWNARLAYELVERGLTVSLWGKNLGNEEYIVTTTDFSGSLGHTIGVAGRPRSYGLTLTLDLGDR